MSEVGDSNPLGYISKYQKKNNNNNNRKKIINKTWKLLSSFDIPNYVEIGLKLVLKLAVPEPWYYSWNKLCCRCIFLAFTDYNS